MAVNIKSKTQLSLYCQFVYIKYRIYLCRTENIHFIYTMPKQKSTLAVEEQTGTPDKLAREILVTDEQAEGKVSARVSALESEWGFLSSLQPKLQAVVPNAERHFITVRPTRIGLATCCCVVVGVSARVFSDRA